jgi:hypothetical protein
MCVKLLKRYSVIIPVEAHLDEDTILQTKFAYEAYASNEAAAQEIGRMFFSDSYLKIVESLKDRISRLVGEDPHFEINGELEISEGHDADAEPEIYQGLLRWDDDR